jgi:hypothetical protein
MSVVDRSDVRASARVLARTARRCIAGELEATTHKVELVSLFRLLNAFRSHGFEGYAYEPRSARGPEALTLKPTVDRHVVDLNGALAGALRESYRTVDENEAIEQIDQVIRSVARSEAPADDARAATVHFLDAFIDHLVVR